MGEALSMVELDGLYNLDEWLLLVWALWRPALVI